MAYLLSDAFARAVGSTHQALGTTKVEVRDAEGECVLDIEFSHRALDEKNAAERVRGELKQSKLRQLWLDVARG